jgi:hypothetical protein
MDKLDFSKWADVRVMKGEVFKIMRTGRIVLGVVDGEP